ncbi:unnamed protein product [Camellia sinensis]
MSSRKKMEEERIIERIIRSLLKLQENQRCINCNDLGPKYVCTTFWTFVCSSCSGVHRKFTHRVKSVSMAKFNAEEVSALQAGGNERAREIYFKEWDPQLHSFPDRRKFTGERSMGRLAMVKGFPCSLGFPQGVTGRTPLSGILLKDLVPEEGLRTEIGFQLTVQGKEHATSFSKRQAEDQSARSAPCLGYLSENGSSLQVIIWVAQNLQGENMEIFVGTLTS